jgi:hypothetical protein
MTVLKHLETREEITCNWERVCSKKEFKFCKKPEASQSIPGVRRWLLEGPSFRRYNTRSAQRPSQVEQRKNFWKYKLRRDSANIHRGGASMHSTN